MGSIALVNGTIYTSFSPFRKSGGVLIYNGLYKIIDNNDKIINFAKKEKIEIIDLQNKFVIPGFIDAHMHLDELGEFIKGINLKEINSINQLCNYISREKDKFKTWIFGHGWDQEKFIEKRWPNHHDIDNCSSDKPLFFSRIDLHSALINQNAINILKNVNQKLYGIEKFPDGSPTGIIKEEAFEELRKVLRGSRNIDEQKEILELAQNELLANGVTSIGFMSVDEKTLTSLIELMSENKLKIRISAYLKPEIMKKSREIKNDDILAIKGIKLFADGSFGSRTALLSYPYDDEPTNHGYEAMSKEDLLENCMRAKELNLKTAIHAIGDKGIDNVIWVYERCGKRNRIEHASLIRDDQFPKIAKIEPFVVVQPHFIISDYWIINRVGKKRSTWVYPFKTLINYGINVAFSTDSPVEPINPFFTIDSAVNRGKNQNIELFKYTQHEAFSILEAYNAYTNDSSLAIDRNDIGKIEIGKKGDLIILDKDPMEYYFYNKVLITIINGDIVYKSSDQNLIH